jgi:hypothetical protein
MIQVRDNGLSLENNKKFKVPKVDVSLRSVD